MFTVRKTSHLREIGVLILVLSASHLNAQSWQAQHLKGITSVTILIEGLDAPVCGLSTDDIKTSVNYIVGASAI